VALDLSRYSLLDDGGGGFDTSRFSLNDPGISGRDDPFYLDATDPETGKGDPKNTWLRKLAKSAVDAEVNPTPKTSAPQSQQPTRSAATTTPVPNTQPSRKWMTSDPSAVGQAEKKGRQAEATTSLAHSVGRLIRDVVAAYAGGAGAGGAGASGGGGGMSLAGDYGAEAAGSTGAAAGGAEAGGAGAGFGTNFMSSFKGGQGGGMGGLLGNYARRETGGIYGSGGQGGFNLGALTKMGGGGGGAGGGGDDVSTSESTYAGAKGIANFIGMARKRKALGLLAAAEGGGLQDDQGGAFFQG
jgi:hypothetical protein